MTKIRRISVITISSLLALTFVITPAGTYAASPTKKEQPTETH